ncbi:S8 family serine peptidase [Actinoplanes sp. RD1]|uniref:S8 family serine peptidase n=1 Tax=Actinoplanes sp. RD1 TaxID=3064538 RepID=UPI002741CA24|nr:S8 family serine peptidase [Actinoplanes sp. RD1]
MSLITRAALHASLAASVVTAVLGLGATAAQAGDEYVKYYTVTSSYNGAQENLSEIAARFLGDQARSPEVFNLNSGRPQPDGGALVDPARLRAGWLLVLPWDAVGGGVQYGVLPTESPKAAVTPKPVPSATPAPSSTRDAGAGTPGPRGTTEAPRPAPSGKPGKSGKSGKSGKCAETAPTGSASSTNWAQLRLAADQAWPQSRGKGQLVAVVDSGVDGNLSPLTGHVAVGSDIVSGSGRGDVDCLGTGTAMAGLIAAQGGSGGGVTGVAPDSTVLPVRITGSAGKGVKVRAADAAAGITAAAGAGATVIALGSYVDVQDPAVAKAVADATEHDIVVVRGASSQSAAGAADAASGKGTLRVGGVGVDSQGAADYQRGGVDVVAPGVNVTSLGITGAGPVTGSGTHYAVALVAGVAALVRSAYPELSAEQVAHRVEVTADKVGSATPPSGSFGWGLVNPAESVTKVLPEEAVPAESDEQSLARMTSGTGSGRVALLVVVTLVALAAAVLLVFRIRRLLRDDTPPEEDAAEPPAGDDTPPPATRPPAVKPSAARETEPLTPGVRPGAGVPSAPAPAPSRVPSAPTPAPSVPSAPAPAEAGTNEQQDPDTDLKASVGAKSAQTKS